MALTDNIDYSKDISTSEETVFIDGSDSGETVFIDSSDENISDEEITDSSIELSATDICVAGCITEINMCLNAVDTALNNEAKTDEQKETSISATLKLLKELYDNKD